MSYANVVSFWQKVSSDKELQQKIDPSTGAVPKLHGGVTANELISLSGIAKQAGFDCSPDELATTEAVIRFWEHVAKDKGLQQSLKPAQSAGSAERASSELARIAGQAGYRFSGDQLDEVTGLLQNTGWMGGQELSTEQLERVAGGAVSLYSSSFSLALSGQLTTNFRIGPGSVAQYM